MQWPERVQYVGMAKSSRDDHVADFPVWTLNEAPQYEKMTFKRIDALFQIHLEEDYTRQNNRNHPNHYAWLLNEPMECNACDGTGHHKDQASGVVSKVKKCKWCIGGIYTPDRATDFPIFMQEAVPEIPGSVRYPIERVVEEIDWPVRGQDAIRQAYLTCSVSYALALAAITDEIQEIDIYGVEAASDTEWGNQKPGIEFLGGYLSGLGKTVWVPEKCRLFNQSLYGYEVGMYISRQELESYMRSYKREYDQNNDKLQQLIGQARQLQGMARASQSVQQRQSYAKKIQELNHKIAQQRSRTQGAHDIYVFSKFLVGRIDGRHPETSKPATLQEMENEALEETEELKTK